MLEVKSRVFVAIQNLDIDALTQCGEDEIRPFLSSLVRMCLLPFGFWPEHRKKIMRLLVGIEAVNNIVSLLQVNYHDLEQEVKKEQQLRQKPQQTAPDSVQFHNLQNGVSLGFERADMTKKVRIVLSEFFFLQSQISEHLATLYHLSGTTNLSRNAHQIVIKSSELFNNDIYLEEIADIICVSLTELPSLLSVQEIVETLLYVNNGNELICWIVANLPDSFKDIVISLISNGDEESVDGRIRLAALYSLCKMNPKQSLSTRALCVELSKMPSLMLRLSVEDPYDLIAFLSGLLLGNDQATRTWFAQFVRTNHKRKSDALQSVRDELLKQLQSLVEWMTQLTNTVPTNEESIVQSTAILRLYCALRGIAGIKFNEDEIQLLMQLITVRPKAATAATVRFVSMGLCMLIACPSLILSVPLETKGTEWVQWLVKEESYFETTADTESASFGEMLLLMAIHFHSNQLSAIGELVCAVLGMKIPLRPNNTTRMKQIFTQEIFTEQVVAAHAIKVPVTVGLNANMPGHLPVHCIHQLLKSRAFSKHKVPIKNWIYKQLCNATTPLHPVIPPLIEAYVMSILIPGGGSGSQAVPLINASSSNLRTEAITHKPLTEAEILHVFQNTMSLSGHTKRRYIDDEIVNVESEEQALPVVGTGTPSQNITAQLLMLYYALLYEDVRLNNNIMSCGRKVKSYSTDFLSELPIKYLLQQAQRNQKNFGGLFSPLLRLLVTHFPHLSLVDDWLEDEVLQDAPGTSLHRSLTEAHVHEVFAKNRSLKCIKLLKAMLRRPPKDLWYLSDAFVSHFKDILLKDTPKVIQELYKQVWIRLNTVLPRRLWAMSTKALIPEHSMVKSFSLSQDHVMIDALHILRCDERVFRCPDALSIVLRILQAGLAASRSQLQRHTQDKPIIEKSGQMEAEREEFKTALIYAQETAAVQILLEACLETSSDQKHNSPWVLQEIRGIICSYIHQVFISDVNVAKLVIFQGFDRKLLPVMVRGVPSMHVCLHSIIELMNMPEADKQIFAIDLTSHLSVQYTMPRSFSHAKLCLNVLLTLLGALAGDLRTDLFRSTLPSIVRFGQAFPPLIDDCINYLLQLGRTVHCQVALGRANRLPHAVHIETTSAFNASIETEKLLEDIKSTFLKLSEIVVSPSRIY